MHEHDLAIAHEWLEAGANRILQLQVHSFADLSTLLRAGLGAVQSGFEILLSIHGMTARDAHPGVCDQLLQPARR